MSMPAPVTCSCSHSLNCNHECHGRHCDPTEHTCSIEFLPDEGGLAPWGCADCTPGLSLPHAEACAAFEAIEVSVEAVKRPHAGRTPGRPQPSAPLS